MNYNSLFDNRHGFDKFEKTYRGTYFGTVVGNDRKEYLLLDSKNKNYRKCLMPPYSLIIVDYPRIKKGAKVKVHFKCRELEDKLVIEGNWTVNDNDHYIRYFIYLEPKTTEQIKCFLCTKLEK